MLSILLDTQENIISGDIADTGKKVGPMLKIIVGIVVVAVVALLAYIRLAPSDPARWHIDIAAADFAPPATWAAYCPGPATVPPPGLTLAKLAEVAEAAPRTIRLAGSVDDGRITWITRSRLFGFPDYATAAMVDSATGPQVCMVSRQRFGAADGGVNAAKLQGWLMAATGSSTPLVLGWKP